MNKVVNGLLVAGLAGSLGFAGGVAYEGGFEGIRGGETPEEHIAEEARAVAQDCGKTALQDAMDRPVNPALTLAEAEAVAQAQIQQQVETCFEDHASKALAGILEAAEIPAVDVSAIFTESEG